jgi:hypothetical protein
MTPIAIGEVVGTDHERTRRAMIPRYAMLDLWMALGGNPLAFEEWMDEPKRTPADAWAQLLAAVRGDVMPGDTNPEPGAILALVWQREVEA